jgi:signal transduction histidine kinase
MMKKLLFFLSFFSSLQLVAQPTISPAYVINADTAGYQTLPYVYWQLLEESTSGKWNINDVSTSPVVNGFHQNRSNNKTLAYSVNTYWIRFRLRNNLSKDVTITLQEQAAFADYYISDKTGSWIHESTGYNKKWSERNGYKYVLAVPYRIKAGEEITVYERIQFDYRAFRPAPLEAGFGFDKKFIEESYVDNDRVFFTTIVGSFFIGLLFIAAVFNFFFFLIVREKVYFYYACCLILGGFNEYHNLFLHVFLRDHPYVINNNQVFFFIFVNFFAIQMERYFLQTFSFFPKWDKALQISILFQLAASIAVYFIGPHLSNAADNMLWNVWDWSQGLVLMCLLITFLLYLRKEDKSARQFILASLPVAAVWVTNYVVHKIAENSFSRQWMKYYERIEVVAVSWLVIILSWILFQRYNKLRKENAEQALLNERLEKEKEIEKRQLMAQQKVLLEKQVAERTAELKQSLEDLKATQKQLIQSEKMASLGELTAGIAHEIQNPLNFVNNFSEINNELIEELKSELLNDHKQEAIEVADDIKENEQKIIQHGKRAENIVKGMLAHSRKSTGKKEPADINALCEEYLKLSYLGLRGKDKTFNAGFKTDFDPNIGKILVIPQDVGRVLLNIFNNAFYSVNEKKKMRDSDYEPAVCVTTKRVGDKVEIKIKDNGLGIPQKALDKIFQPFFTTKPTGQGTGLGLSLSYDIIKAEGGDLQVNTMEGEFAEFVILLPLQKEPGEQVDQ